MKYVYEGRVCVCTYYKLFTRRSTVKVVANVSTDLSFNFIVYYRNWRN